MKSCGIGINIAPESISPVNLPPSGLNFPATCVESALGHSIDRVEFLHAILQEFLAWLPRLSLPEFILEWEACLAFRHQWVELTGVDMRTTSPAGDDLTVTREVKVIGLAPNGSLKVITSTGRLVTVSSGEIHLRPAATDRHFPPLD